MTTYQSKRDEILDWQIKAVMEAALTRDTKDMTITITRELLDKYRNKAAKDFDQLVQTEVRKARIEELESIPRTRSKQAYIENRLAQLNKEDKDE